MWPKREHQCVRKTEQTSLDFHWFDKTKQEVSYSKNPLEERDGSISSKAAAEGGIGALEFEAIIVEAVATSLLFFWGEVI